MTTEQAPDPEKLRAKTLEIAGLYRGAYISAMVCLGIRLGLYPVLRDAGAVTSEELASRTGLHERWLREWLRGQAAAGLIDYLGEGRFQLSPETAALLADQDSLPYLGNQFDALPHHMERIRLLTDAFRTGVGLSWDERGPESAGFTEQLFRNWYRHLLVPTALPLLDGVVAKLESGAKVADVGCGSGIALIEMAQAFPRSDFHGYEISDTRSLGRRRTVMRPVRPTSPSTTQPTTPYPPTRASI